MEGNTTVRDFFNSINLSLLPDNAANFISNDVLKDKDLDLIAKDEPVFLQLEEFIKTKYSSALGIEDTEPTIERLIEEVIQPSLKEELQSIIDGYETLLEIEDDEKIIKRLKLKIGILKDEISKMEDGGEVFLEKSVTDENMFEAGGKLAYIREDILGEDLEVPVGDDYIGNSKGYQYKYDDDGNFLILHNGEWKEAESSDWDFGLSEQDGSEDEIYSQNIAMFTTSYGEDVIGFVSEKKGLGDYEEFNMVYYVLEDDITGSFIVCAGLLQDGIIINGSEYIDDHFADKDAAIKAAKDLAFPNNNLIGKRAVIIENIEDHLGYNGEELTVIDTTDDKYLILRNEENGLSFMASEDELKFSN